MRRIIPTLGIPLILTAALVRGDGLLPPEPPLNADVGQSYSLAFLPWTLEKTPASKSLTPLPMPRSYQAPSAAPHRYGPGDSIPRAYMVYGLRTSLSGMAFTDENGKVLMQASPQVITGPFVSSSPILRQPPFTLPKPLKK